MRSLVRSQARGKEDHERVDFISFLPNVRRFYPLLHAFRQAVIMDSKGLLRELFSLSIVYVPSWLLSFKD